MKTKHPVNIIMFGVIIYDGDVMLSMIFPHDLILNSKAYT